jgi:competence protein ComFC
VKCLICYEEFRPLFTFQMLLTLQRPDVLCERCRQQFLLIEGTICERCGRPFHEQICNDCIQWEMDGPEVLTKNRSVYMYNDWMKEVIARFKFRGDYAIVEAFRADFTRTFHGHFHSDVSLVPIPLSECRLMERGFNQAEALASFLSLPIFNALERLDDEKQSKKQRNERFSAPKFYVKDKQAIAGKAIVLIDDIYTTGATVYHAAKQLREAGASDVSSFTLIRA